MADKYDISVILRVLDKATGPLQQIARKFEALRNPVTAVEKDMRALGKTVQDVGNKMSSAGQKLSLKMTLPLTLMGGMATKTAIDFEKSWTGVLKTVEASDAEFANLKKELLAVARNTGVSTETLFGLAEAAGQLDVKKEHITDFAKVMADMAVSTDITAEMAASDMAKFANIIQMPQTQFRNLGSTISGLGNASAATESEILNMGMRLVSAGALAKMSAAQVMSLASGLSSVGIEAEAGGTAFSQVISKIGKEIGTGSKTLKGFAYVAGKTAKEFENAWKKDAATAMIEFTEGLLRLEKQGVNINTVLDDLGFEGIRISNALRSAALSGNLFRDQLQKGSKFWKENIALTKEANKFYASIGQKLLKVKEIWRQTIAPFGDILASALLKMTTAMVPFMDWLKSLDPAFKKMIVVAGALLAALGPLLVIIGGLVTAVGGLMIFGPIAAGLLPIAGIVALIVVGLTAWIYAIIKVVRNWKIFADVAKQFKIILLGIGAAIILATAPFSTIVAIALAFAGAALLVMENWEPIKNFFVNLFDAIGAKVRAVTDAIKAMIPEWLRRWLTGGVAALSAAGAGGPHIATGGGSSDKRGANAFTSAARAASMKSETDVNIKVSSDPGSTATVEKVKQKKGDAKVNVATAGYVGAY